MKKKLFRNRKGESLLETLAAILIFTLASFTLYSMVNGSVNLNSLTRARSREMAEQIAIAEKMSEPQKTGIFIMKIDGEEAYRTMVSIYGGVEDQDGHRSLYSVRIP